MNKLHEKRKSALEEVILREMPDTSKFWPGHYSEPVLGSDSLASGMSGSRCGYQFRCPHKLSPSAVLHLLPYKQDTLLFKMFVLIEADGISSWLPPTKKRTSTCFRSLSLLACSPSSKLPLLRRCGSRWIWPASRPTCFLWVSRSLAAGTFCTPARSPFGYRPR